MPLTEFDIEDYINKYNDVVIKIKYDYDKYVENKKELEDILKDYDPKVGYILHIHKNVKISIMSSLPKGEFEYITTKKGVLIFGNKRVIEKSPLLVNGETSGSITVLRVENNNIEYVVCVKDRTKDKLTNPAGTRDLNETFIECASRECWEETSVRPKENELKQIGSFDFTSHIFEVKWIGRAKVFSTPTIHLSNDEFKTLQTFECDEISNVYCIPIENGVINWDNVIKEGHLLSDHHKLCAKYAVSNGSYDWEKEKPNYLKNFILF